MTEKELLTLAEKYQAKADRNYRNYQETGISRYDRESRHAEELADAMRMAANAAEDHQMLGSYRSYIYQWGLRARKLIKDPCVEKEIKLLNDLVYVAESFGLLRREEEVL